MSNSTPETMSTLTNLGEAVSATDQRTTRGAKSQATSSSQLKRYLQPLESATQKHSMMMCGTAMQPIVTKFHLARPFRVARTVKRFGGIGRAFLVKTSWTETPGMRTGTGSVVNNRRKTNVVPYFKGSSQRLRALAHSLVMWLASGTSEDTSPR